MDTYGYIYITENIINNKRYIGQHRSSDWDYNYFGSGKILKQTITKYGIKNFTCFPPAWAWSKEELNQLEIDYIAHYNPEYNITKGGQGFNIPHSEETKKKCGIKNIGRKHTHEHIQKQKLGIKGIRNTEASKLKTSISSTGRNWYTNGIKDYFRKECPDGCRLGKTFGKKYSKYKRVAQ